MGNLHHKNIDPKNQKHSVHTRNSQVFTSQFSLSHFVGNLSGRSFASVTSSQSVYSASRPWSRISRRRWNDSTLKNPLEASKTAWPVANKESIFLPEYPITTDLLQKDFEIVETIAKGAFGEVIKVKKLSDTKEYALKVLYKSQIVCDNAVRQVKEEARIQAAVGHHIFIAGAVSRWQTKKRLYIVSEYIPGGELLALLDKYSKLPEELVRIFVYEIAIAIDFLHNAGVIYRDLKPENILLDSNYHIQLVDFGLSKWLSIGARTTTLCGTLKYIAPEVVQREPYGHAADWWSLGVLACKMLTGEFPTPVVIVTEVTDTVMNVNTSMDSRAGCTEKDTSKRQQQKSIHPNPGALPDSSKQLSNAARALLMRLLDRDPKVRLRNLRQLQQTAFFLGFHFDLVKTKKISPKYVLEQHFSDINLNTSFNNDNKQHFLEFNQNETVF